MATNIKYPGPYIAKTMVVDSGIVSGSPVQIGGVSGTALVDRGEEVTNSSSVVLSPHIADHSVEAVDADGNNAVVIGDAIYYDSAATIKLNKDNVNGVFYGWALEAITSGSSDTIQTLVCGGGAGLPVVRQQAQASAVMDLSGAAVVDSLILHTGVALQLLNVYLVYVELTSADAGVTVTVGHETDNDYYFTGTSAVSQAAWTEVDLTLLNTDVPAGNTVVCGTAGGKTGTGTVLIAVEYALA
jgi:hypothetical protein